MIGLKHNDRIALGHCAYVFLVVDPAAVLNAVLAASNKSTEASTTATATEAKNGRSNRKWPFFGNKKSPEAAVEDALQPGGDATGGDGGGNGSLKVVWDDRCLGVGVLECGCRGVGCALV